MEILTRFHADVARDAAVGAEQAVGLGGAAEGPGGSDDGGSGEEDGTPDDRDGDDDGRSSAILSDETIERLLLKVWRISAQPTNHSTPIPTVPRIETTTRLSLTRPCLPCSA
eukprot:366410-Chlamydomonas_euryale.AAC.32